jgi:PAS domain S-box-containing protein
MGTRTCRRLFAAVACIATLPALVCPTASAQPQPHTVLALFWSTEDYPANAVHDEGIREGLLSNATDPIDYYTEYLESDRFPEPQASDALREYLRRKYAGRHIDLVIAMTDVALRFALRHRADLFPGAPIVFFGNSVPEADRDPAGGGSTGVIVMDGYRATLELALAMHPATERMFIVLQTPDPAQLELTRTALQQLVPAVPKTFIVDDSTERMIDAVKAIPPRSVLIYVRHSQEDPGRILFSAQAARLVAEASPVPVYGVSDSYLGTGVVGGVVYQTRAIGKRIGEMARLILGGARVENMPVERATQVATFDWRQLRRWNISESRLPAGSVIEYRQPGAWELYRPQIIGGAVLVLSQSVFIAALLVQGARRRRTANELRESQQRYRLATGAGAVGVWDWHLDTNEIYVDPSLKSMLGFTDAEIPNRIDDWGARVYAEDAPAVMAEAQRCIDGEVDVYEIAHRMVHRNGSLRWFLARGSFVKGANGSRGRLVGTDTDITGRKQAEELIRENQAVLEASHREIRDLAGRLIASQDVERARIARELHDDLSQQIAGLSIALSGLKHRIGAKSDADALASEVASLQHRALGLADNIRHLSHDLHPSVLKHAGLVAALSAHCADVERQHSLEVTFMADGDFESTSSAAALCLYRVAQEGLRNVVTHARAVRAEVSLRRRGDHAELTIVDNGQGFDITQASVSGHGLGLVSINERVRLVGGTVSIVTELNKGTRLHVQIPANGHGSEPQSH